MIDLKNKARRQLLMSNPKTPAKILPDGDSQRRPRSPLGYKAYLEERRNLIQGEHHLADTFDKLVVGGAAGALVLSVTFVHQMKPLACGTKPLLFSGWVILFVSLACALGSMLSAQQAFRRRWEALDAEQDKNVDIAKADQLNASAEKWNAWTDRLNLATSVALVGGIIFLAVFAAMNLE